MRHFFYSPSGWHEYSGSGPVNVWNGQDFVLVQPKPFQANAIITTQNSLEYPCIAHNDYYAPTIGPDLRIPAPTEDAVWEDQDAFASYYLEGTRASYPPEHIMSLANRIAFAAGVRHAHGGVPQGPEWFMFFFGIGHSPVQQLVSKYLRYQATQGYDFDGGLYACRH